MNSHLIAHDIVQTLVFPAERRSSIVHVRSQFENRRHRTAEKGGCTAAKVRQTPQELGGRNFNVM
jgi:hypothetical protein